MDNKVDKEPGKGLSSNDYTSEEKTLVGTIINKVDKVQGKGLSTYDLTESRKNKLDSYPELTGAGNKALMDNGTFVEITGEGIIFSDIEIINIEDLQVEYVTEEIYNKIANAIINNRHIVLNSINRSDVSPFSLRAAEPINVITYSVIRQEYLNFTNRDIFLVITDGTTTTEITIESTFHVTIIKRPSSISLDNSNPLPTVELTQTSIGLQANLVLAKSDSGVQLVKTEDGLVAQLSIDSNGYPAIMNLNGTNYNWIRTSAEGILPNTAITLVNGGASALGASGWAFKNGYIANVYANKYSFGSSGVYFRLDGDNKIALTSASAARGMEVGNLLVSSNYSSDAAKVPVNGIFASGRIQSNDSMLVGYSRNVTEGMLGYGLYYDGTFAQGLGSEYSSGALVLYKILNPNTGKAGYNVPRATTGTPTYLKITNGTLTLGVGETKAYTAGEDVTVTEYDVLTSKGGTIGPLTISGMGSSPFVVNNYDINGTDIYQIFRVQGYNRFLVGWSETSGGPFIQRSSDNSCILIKSDGAYWGSSLDASAIKKLATQEWVLEQLEALKTS